MARGVLLVMDSVGIGGAPDAADYGDPGADTLGHIAEYCARGQGDNAIRRGPLRLPELAALGLGLAAAGASGRLPPGLEPPAQLRGAHGHAREISRGKDTPSGHWELTGVPVTTDWGYFPDTCPCFPAALTATLIERGGLPGILGDRHASGTGIIAELGEEHCRSGKPIVYTSADSVLQIAAHEQHFGLERLYRLCELARELVDAWNIGRVIARPFVGESSGDFRRTAGRRDYATPPPAPTLLERVVAAGGRVYAIGKIADIFAHRGISVSLKADGLASLLDRTLEALGQARDGDLVIANLVDFDTLYGHRRDVAGYAAALEYFDTRLGALLARLERDDRLIISADHGNDPSWRGTDHTREQVPVLLCGPAQTVVDAGQRASFADVGQTLARHLRLDALPVGTALPL